MPTHHFYDVRPVVGTSGIPYAVYGLERCIERRVDTYGYLGASNVIVYGGRDPHHLHTEFAQL